VALRSTGHYDRSVVSGDPEIDEKRVTENSKQGTVEWWNSRRPTYNAGLVFAGIAAFICYAILVWSSDQQMTPAPGSREPREITLFTMGLQAVGYLLMIGVANICYGLGQLSERLLRPTDVKTFRNQVFALGFCFSVLLPFTMLLSWL
jgi:hypothetical protein